jgi:hypothetical protein
MTASDDAMLIGHLAKRGCDLTRHREVGVHFHASSEVVADDILRDLRAEGWDPEIFFHRDEWLVAGLGKWMAVNEQSISRLRHSCEDLAIRHGAIYYGWQASLDAGMDVE